MQICLTCGSVHHHNILWIHLLSLHLDFITKGMNSILTYLLLSLPIFFSPSSHSLAFFPTCADRRAFTHTYTLRFPSPRSQLSILQCVALSSHTSPSLPFPHSCFLLSLPLSSCFTLALPALLLSAPSVLPLLLSFLPLSLY